MEASKRMASVILTALAVLVCGCGGTAPARAPSTAAHASSGAGPAPRAPSSAPASTRASGSASSAGKLFPVKLTYITAAVSGMPVYVAQSQGFFKRNGLDVRLVRMASAATISALSKGEIQFTNNSTLAIQGASKGLPFRIVYNVHASSPWQLVGLKSIHSVAEMKGHTVGADPPGGATYAYLQAGLQKAGLTMGDVKEVPLGGVGVTYPALLAGRIDAAVLSPPTDIQAQQKGFHDIAFLGDLLQVPFTGLATTSAFIAQHRPVVVSLIRSIWEASAWMRSHPQATVALSVKVLGMTPAVARQAYNELTPLLTRTGKVTTPGVQQDIQLLSQATHTPVSLTPAQVTDYGPLAEALAKEPPVPPAASS